MKFLEKLKMDIIVDSRNSYRKDLQSLLEYSPYAKIVDLGCGDPERTLRLIAETTGASPVYGADVFEERDSWYTIWKQDLNGPLSYADESFHVVVASQIIEHLGNTDTFVNEIVRILKPGGYAIVSTPNLAAWQNVLYLLLGRQPEVVYVSDFLDSWKESPGHMRVFTPKALKRLLTFWGLTVEAERYSEYVPFAGRLGKLLAGLDKNHAGIVTIKARKDKEI